MIQQVNAELKKTSLFVVLFGQKIFCIQSQDTIKVHVYAHNASVPSDIHQSQYRDGCQVIGRSYSFIFDF